MVLPNEVLPEGEHRYEYIEHEAVGHSANVPKMAGGGYEYWNPIEDMKMETSTFKKPTAPPDTTDPGSSKSRNTNYAIAGSSEDTERVYWELENSAEKGDEEQDKELEVNNGFGTVMTEDNNRPAVLFSDEYAVTFTENELYNP